jgi:hypothetical protein
MDDLNVLVPSAVTVTVGGESLAITPLRIGELPAFTRALAPAVAEFRREGIDWLALFGLHGEAMLTALAVASRRPREWIEQLAADEAILLAATIIEVNSDFFARRVLPKVEAAMARLPAQGPTAGSTSPSGSSAPATASPTS